MKKIKHKTDKLQQVILFREMLSPEPVKHVSHNDISEHVTYIQLMLECCAGTFVSVVVTVTTI